MSHFFLYKFVTLVSLRVPSGREREVLCTWEPMKPFWVALIYYMGFCKRSIQTSPSFEPCILFKNGLPSAPCSTQPISGSFCQSFEQLSLCRLVWKKSRKKGEGRGVGEGGKRSNNQVSFPPNLVNCNENAFDSSRLGGGGGGKKFFLIPLHAR